MNLKKLLLTENNCYKANRKHTVKGIVVHSTGANNPALSRYVGPDDGLLGVNKYGNHWNQDKPDGRSVCVHGFIGKLKDGSVATYQTLPWDIAGWHSGAGDAATAKKNGFAGNNANFLGYVGFEICEDGLTDKAYFDKVYTEAVELCAMLCKTYNIKPESPSLICHSEGNKLGIASNHGDVMHWFPKHGKSMDTFRADVKKLLGTTTPVTPPTVPAPPPPTTVADKTIWDFLKGKGLNDFAVAGVMGNLFAESGLKATNLQNSYESKLGLTDAAYTKVVDNGSYTNFVKDSAGYGLAQWTFYTRKQALLDFAKAARASIGDLTMQLNFLWKELQGYAAVINTLKTSTSVLEASNVVLLQFERPADQSAAVQTKRAGFGQGYYDKFAGKTVVPPTPPVTPPTTDFTPYTVKITASVLNYRAGAGTNFKVNGTVKKGEVYTIVAEADGAGAKKWGQLKSKAGWLSLDYTVKN